ncbi:MAG: LysM peptidoglycan-binding domain-containing protein [Dehalococcoidia bacterium]
MSVVNREDEDTIYQFEVRVDGDVTDKLESIHLAEGETWENRVNIAPDHVGPRQKVEFLLYREGEGDPYRSLHLFIDVEGESSSSTSSLTAASSPTPATELVATDRSSTGFSQLDQTGDTLAPLEERFGLSPNTVAAADGLDASETIEPERELVIPEVLYVIQPGDTLTDIAVAFEVSLAAIVAANDLEDASKISPGLEIVIPEDRTSGP